MRLRAHAGPIVFLLLALAAPRAAADPTGRHLYLAPVVGHTTFDGKLRYPTNPIEDGFYWGGRLGYRYWDWLAFEIAGGATNTREMGTDADISFWHASGNLVFTPWRSVYGTPFLSAGYGQAKLSHEDPNATLSVPNVEPGEVSQGNLELAGGFDLWLTDALAVRLEHRQLSWIAKDEWKSLSRTFVSSLGVTYAIGGSPRDTDLDGVPDRRDDCPNTPKGATVDDQGCPHDTDNDGVLDGLDRCPGTPTGATIDSTGCPSDADQDGVWDGLDRCADTPRGARVDSAGCTSDADQDGVLDGLDRCEGTPTGAKVDSTGCPIDTDGDGVADGLDQCENTTRGIEVDAKGCPIAFVERETELLDTGAIRLQNVTFETGKAVLAPASLPILDSVGDLLSQWPQLKMEIGGHTDSQGSKRTNAKLSQARADSVRAYLLRRFPRLSPDQFTTKGYGSTVSIAPNTTEGGRQQNRRVEFVVKNKDVLIREIERRRPAPAPTPAPQDTTGGSKP